MRNLRRLERTENMQRLRMGSPWGMKRRTRCRTKKVSELGFCRKSKNKIFVTKKIARLES